MYNDFEYVKRILKGALFIEGADPEKCRQETGGFPLAKNQKVFVDKVIKGYEEWWDKGGKELFEEKFELVELVRENPDKDTTEVWARIDEIEDVVDKMVRELFKGEFNVD